MIVIDTYSHIKSYSIFSRQFLYFDTEELHLRHSGNHLSSRDFIIAICTAKLAFLHNICSVVFGVIGHNGPQGWQNIRNSLPGYIHVKRLYTSGSQSIRLIDKFSPFLYQVKHGVGRVM